MIIRLFVTTSLSLNLLTALGGCTTMNDTNAPPCYDGWTDNGSFISKLLSPDAIEYKNIVSFLADYKVHCIHHTSATKTEYVVVATRRGSPDLLAVTVRQKDGRFAVVEEEVIV